VQGEGLLRSALEHAGDAPDAWKSSATILMVTALAAQGRSAEAVAAVDNLSGGTPSDLLFMLGELSKAGRQAEGDLKRQLAQLEVNTIQALGDRAQQLRAADRKQLDRLHALALAETGDREQALKLLDALAQRNPKDGGIQEDLAALWSQSRAPADLRKAIDKWGQVAQKSRGGTPRWFRANLAMAQAQLALGKRPQARAIVKLVQATHPDFGGDALRQQFQRVLAECEKK
jgi:tetratricopeptide (TPR) repeat protein